MTYDLRDYIMVLDNAITPALCDAILAEYTASDEWLNTVVGSEAKIDKNIRSASTIILSQNSVMQQNLKVRRKLDRYIFASAGNAINKYRSKFPDVFVQEDSGYELLRYTEGQFYTQHTDSFKGRPRSISCSFALNDDYEGGEWGFFDRAMQIKPPKGAAILFPSNFMYPHEIMPITKGVRYSVITWFI
jgi:hypothetical protein